MDHNQNNKKIGLNNYPSLGNLSANTTTQSFNINNLKNNNSGNLDQNQMKNNSNNMNEENNNNEDNSKFDNSKRTSIFMKNQNENLEQYLNKGSKSNVKDSDPFEGYY